MSKKTWLLVASSILATTPIISYITINTAHKNNIDNSNIDKQYQALSNDKNIAYFYASDLKEIAELIDAPNKAYNQENFNLAKTKIAKLLTLKTLIDKESNNQLEWNSNNISLLSKYYNNEYENTKKELLDKETGYYEALSNNDRQKLNKYVSSANRLAGEDKVFYRNLVINYFKDNQESLERFKALQAEIKSLKDTILEHLKTFDTTSTYYQKIIKSLEHNYNKIFLEGIKNDVISKNELKTNLDNVNYNISINPKYSNELEYWYSVALSTYKITDIAKLLILPIKDINNFKTLKLVIKAKDEVFEDNQLKQEYYLENNVESDFYVSIEYEIVNEELNLKYPLRKKLYPLVYSYLQNNNDYFSFKENYKPFWNSLHINDTETKHIMFVNSKPYLKNIFFKNVYSDIKSKWKSLVDIEKAQGIKFKTDTLINSYATNSEYQPIRDYFNSDYDSFYSKNPSLSEDLFWTYQQYLTNQERNKQLKLYLNDFKDILASKNDFEIKNQSLARDLKEKLLNVKASDYRLAFNESDDNALLSSLEQFFNAFSLNVNYKDTENKKGIYDKEHLFNKFILEFYKKLVVSYNTDNSAYLLSLTEYLSAYKKLIKTYESNINSDNSTLNEFYKPFLAKFLIVDFADKDSANEVLKKYYANEILVEDINKRIDGINNFINNYNVWKNKVVEKINAIDTTNTKYYAKNNEAILEAILNHYHKKFKDLNIVDKSVFDNAYSEIDAYIATYQKLVSAYSIYQGYETGLELKSDPIFYSNDEISDVIAYDKLESLNFTFEKDNIINYVLSLNNKLKDKMDFDYYMEHKNEAFYSNNTEFNDLDAFIEKLKALIVLDKTIRVDTDTYKPQISFDNNYNLEYTKQFFIDTLNNKVNENTRNIQNLVNKDLINNHLKLTFKDKVYNNLITNNKDTYDVLDDNYKAKFRVDNNLNTYYQYDLFNIDTEHSFFNVSKTINLSLSNADLNINYYTIPTQNSLSSAVSKIKNNILNIAKWTSLSGNDTSKKNAIKDNIIRALELEEFRTLKSMMENDLESLDTITAFFDNLITSNIYSKTHFNNLSTTISKFANDFFWLKDNENYLLFEAEFANRLQSTFRIDDNLAFEKRYLARHNWIDKNIFNHIFKNTSASNKYNRQYHSFTNINLDDALIRPFYQNTSILDKQTLLSKLRLNSFNINSTIPLASYGNNQLQFNSNRELQFTATDFKVRNTENLKVNLGNYAVNLFDLKTDDELKAMFIEALKDNNYSLEEYLTTNLFEPLIRNRWNENVRNNFERKDNLIDNLFMTENVLKYALIEVANPSVDSGFLREEREKLSKPLVRLKNWTDKSKYDNWWLPNDGLGTKIIDIEDNKTKLYNLWLSQNANYNNTKYTTNWYIYQFLNKFKDSADVKNIVGNFTFNVKFERRNERGTSYTAEYTSIPYINVYHIFTHKNTITNGTVETGMINRVNNITKRIYLKVMYEYDWNYNYSLEHRYNPERDNGYGDYSEFDEIETTEYDIRIRPVIVPYIDDNKGVFENRMYNSIDNKLVMDYTNKDYIVNNKIAVGTWYDIESWFENPNFSLAISKSNKNDGIKKDIGSNDTSISKYYGSIDRNERELSYGDRETTERLVNAEFLMTWKDGIWNNNINKWKNAYSVYDVALPVYLKKSAPSYVSGDELRFNEVVER